MRYLGRNRARYFNRDILFVRPSGLWLLLVSLMVLPYFVYFLFGDEFLETYFAVGVLVAVCLLLLILILAISIAKIRRMRSKGQSETSDNTNH